MKPGLGPGQTYLWLRQEIRVRLIPAARGCSGSVLFYEQIYSRAPAALPVYSVWQLVCICAASDLMLFSSSLAPPINSANCEDELHVHPSSSLRSVFMHPVWGLVGRQRTPSESRSERRQELVPGLEIMAPFQRAGFIVSAPSWSAMNRPAWLTRNMKDRRRNCLCGCHVPLCRSPDQPSDL